MLINKKAFSFIELTIVLVIIVILGTVGFISYSNHLLGVRDTARITDLNKISNLLIVQTTKGKLPLPDDYIEIVSSGSLIGYQGYAGETVLSNIGLVKGGKDPKNGAYYSYYITKNKKYFQLMGFLEDSANSQASAIFSKTYANIEYPSLFPIVVGSKLGIFAGTGDDLNIPVQEIESIKSAGKLDIAITTTEYSSYISNTKITTGDKNQLIFSIPNISCARILESGASIGNGTYKITSTGGIYSQIYCDMELIASSGVVGGICGFSHNNNLDSAPSGENLCNSGSSNNVTSGDLLWTWTCYGINGGDPTSCHAYKNINGVCGSDDDKNLLTTPTNLCSEGIDGNVEGTGPWTWSCEGNSSGSNDSCNADLKINGMCGSDDEDNFSSAPSSNLCNAGTQSSVEGTGPWTRMCNGINEGTNTGCSAYFTLPSGSDAKLWLKADSLSGVLSNNDSVSIWTGSSQNNNVTGTGDTLPVYKTSMGGIFGGTKPVVYFDGSSSSGFFINDNLSYVSSGSHSIFVVFHPLFDDTDQEGILGFYDSGGNNEEVYFVKGTGSSSGNIYHYDSNLFTLSSNNNYDTDILFTVLLKDELDANDYLTGYVNGVGMGGIDTLPGSDSDKFSIGQDYDGSDTSDFFKGYMAEIIIYDKLVSSQEKQEIEDYLYGKYNFSY